MQGIDIWEKFLTYLWLSSLSIIFSIWMIVIIGMIWADIPWAARVVAIVLGGILVFYMGRFGWREFKGEE